MYPRVNHGRSGRLQKIIATVPAKLNDISRSFATVNRGHLSAGMKAIYAGLTITEAKCSDRRRFSSRRCRKWSYISARIQLYFFAGLSRRASDCVLCKFRGRLCLGQVSKLAGHAEILKLIVEARAWLYLITHLPLDFCPWIATTLA